MCCNHTSAIDCIHCLTCATDALLLQDLLNIERSEALDPDVLDDNAADCFLDIEDDYDDCDEYEADDCDDDEETLEEQLQAYPVECAASESESESSDHALSPARVMSFSDELRSFTPPALAVDCTAPKRPVLRTRPRVQTALPRVARRSNNHEPRASSRTPITTTATSHRHIDNRSKDNNNNDDSEAHALPPPHRHTPRASRSSLKLLRESATFEPNFQARMRQFVAQNRQKKEQIRLAVCEQEDVCLQPTPTINRVRTGCLCRTGTGDRLRSRSRSCSNLAHSHTTHCTSSGRSASTGACPT